MEYLSSAQQATIQKFNLKQRPYNSCRYFHNAICQHTVQNIKTEIERVLLVIIYFRFRIFTFRTLFCTAPAKNFLWQIVFSLESNSELFVSHSCRSLGLLSTLLILKEGFKSFVNPAYLHELCISFQIYFVIKTIQKYMKYGAKTTSVRLSLDL